MKKLLFIIALIIWSNTMYAQNYLTHTIKEADELLGTPKKDIYNAEDVAIIDDGKKPIFQFRCRDHIFQRGNYFIVGVYNDSDSLLIKCERWNNFINDNGRIAVVPMSSSTKHYNPEIMGIQENPEPGYDGEPRYRLTVRNLIDYLLNGNGYVRFHTTTYGNYPYDVIIHCSNYKRKD